jgi:hypothetical protein
MILSTTPKPAADDNVRGGDDPSPTLPQPDVAAAQEASSVLPAGERAAAAVPRTEPSPISGQRFFAPLERLLIAVGLRSSTDVTHTPSSLSRFGTSPRFVTWFLWFQILFGWLLATLFIAGVSGIVHK